MAIAREIHNRFHAMKTYGKEPESLVSITSTLMSDLAEFPPDKILKAFKTHARRSEEFPTSANLISLIKRNGKPPIKESDIIAIRKKDGGSRTRAEWEILREWEAQQQEGWREYSDPVKDSAILQDNIRLRRRIKELEAENIRVWAQVKAQRLSAEPPKFSHNDRIINTVESMRESAVPEEDIQAFRRMMGVCYAQPA